MNSLLIYAFVIILGIVSLRYGKLKSNKQIRNAGITILLLSVVIPLVAFAAGVFIGINS